MVSIGQRPKADERIHAMGSLGGPEVLLLAVFGLPLLSWIVLYARGARARDMIFWSVILVLVPLLGPLAALVFAWRLKKDKRKNLESASA
jgi:hypothetical protein